MRVEEVYYSLWVMQVHGGQFLHEHFKGSLAVEDVPGVVVQPVLNLRRLFLRDVLHALPFRKFAANQNVCVFVRAAFRYKAGSDTCTLEFESVSSTGVVSGGLSAGGVSSA